MRVWKILAMGTLLSVAGHAYMYVTFSKLRAFNEIQLGDRVEKVDMLMAKGFDTCQTIVDLSAAAPSRSRCYFSDTWHNYEIVVNPATCAVVRKSVSWNRPGRGITPLAQKIMNWALGEPQE